MIKILIKTSKLRTLLTGRSNLKKQVLPFCIANKKEDLHPLIFYGGRYKARTCDPLNVVQVRYQLRQSPINYLYHKNINFYNKKVGYDVSHPNIFINSTLLYNKSVLNSAILLQQYLPTFSEQQLFLQSLSHSSVLLSYQLTEQLLSTLHHLHPRQLQLCLLLYR